MQPQTRCHACRSGVSSENKRNEKQHNAAEERKCVNNVRWLLIFVSTFVFV